MKRNALARVAVTCLFSLGFVAYATAASAAEIVGGNDVVARATSDSYANFSILDTNNPISASGELESWSIYAPVDAGPVELLIYQTDGPAFTLVGQSSLETPASAGGLQTFSLPGGLSVQAGDFVGLYFQDTGSAEYDNTGGDIYYTANESGVGDGTTFQGPLNRTYSVSVSGTTVPEPATWALMILGLGMIGFAARRRQKVSVTYA